MDIPSTDLKLKSFALTKGQTYLIDTPSLIEKEEIVEAKVQNLIGDAATKMSGIDVRLDTTQQTSEEITVQKKDLKSDDLQGKHDALQKKWKWERRISMHESHCEGPFIDHQFYMQPKSDKNHDDRCVGNDDNCDINCTENDVRYRKGSVDETIRDEKRKSENDE
uniref:Uncharacterized protein n=1 Tax=Romanomermis culicivorax TaxID=13658 RepID=A0A915IB49_ROMCU